MLVDDEWRTETDGGFAATKDEKAALEGEIDYLVAHGSYWCAGLLVFDELNADHEASAANVADGWVFGDPCTKALEHLFAYGGGVLQAFALEDVHGGDSGGDADGVAAEGAGMRAGDPVHDFSFRHADA